MGYDLVLPPRQEGALVEPGVIDTDPWHEMDQPIDELEKTHQSQLRCSARRLFAPKRSHEEEEP